MATKISICSNAALLVGAAPIANPTDNTTAARLTFNLYDHVRDDLLRAHPWNFATKRVKLSPLTSQPAYGYLYEYNLPADCLRVLGIDYPLVSSDFRIEGGRVLANTNSLNLRYVFKNEDVATWSPDFVAVVTYTLASLIAYPIAKSDSLRQTLEQKVLFKTQIAKANNGLENPSQRLISNPLMQARY